MGVAGIVVAIVKWRKEIGGFLLDMIPFSHRLGLAKDETDELGDSIESLTEGMVSFETPAGIMADSLELQADKVEDVATAVADDLVPALEDAVEEFDAVKNATEDWETAFVDAIQAAQTEAEQLNFAENIRAQLDDAFAATEVFAENSKVEIRGLTTDASGAYDDLWATIVEGNEKAQGDVAAFIKETNEEIAAEHAEFQEEMAEVRADHEQKMQEAAEKRYSDLFGSIKSKFGNIFESMIAGGQNPITALAEYFKNVFSDIFFEDILGAFVAKWLTPLAGKVQDILGGAVSAITGIGGGAATGLASSAAGSVGGSVAGSTAGSVAGGAAGGAFAGIGTGLVSGGLSAVGGIVGGLINRGSMKDTAGQRRKWSGGSPTTGRNGATSSAGGTPTFRRWIRGYFRFRATSNACGSSTKSICPIIASNTAAINVSINQNISGNAEGFGSIREANRELVEGIKEAFRANTAGLRTEIVAARP